MFTKNDITLFAHKRTRTQYTHLKSQQTIELLRNRIGYGRSLHVFVHLFAQANKNKNQFSGAELTDWHYKFIFEVSKRQLESNNGNDFLPACFGIVIGSLNWPMFLVKIRRQLKLGTAIAAAICTPLHPTGTMAIRQYE